MKRNKTKIRFEQIWTYTAFKITGSYLLQSIDAYRRAGANYNRLSVTRFDVLQKSRCCDETLISSALGILIFFC